MIVFLTTEGEFKVVPTSIEPIVIFLPRAMTDLKTQLMEHPQEESMATSLGVEGLRPSPWPGLNFSEAVEHLVPSWPLPTQSLPLTYQSNFALIFTAVHKGNIQIPFLFRSNAFEKFFFVE
uniref:Uncharacterized protein n=1 Tax=Oryza rufipogon TaxID=4529 RepID=A0A0E0MVH4_ORYRU